MTPDNRSTRLLHVSDLHLGAEDSVVAEALLRDVAAVVKAGRIDALLISGDLTQRARTGEFEHAIDFVRKLTQVAGDGAAVLLTPGNHDVPLWDFMRRVLDPFGNYKRAVAPLYADRAATRTWSNGHAAVASVVTARRCSGRLRGFWKDGLLAPERLKEPLEFLKTSATKWRVLMTHHPVAVAEGLPAGEIVHGWGECRAMIAEAGVNVICGGHLHEPYHTPAEMPGIVYIAAGTAISTRRRHSPNSYNVLDLREGMCIERRDFGGESFGMFGRTLL